ncbi:MAG: hypothetical protein JOZ48_00865 [Acidobacteriaceae bacterium]|nr:hypothetical protein [Acidobacteriaceae bacterium]
MIGAVGSIAATRLLRSQLYGVKSTDPWVFGIVAVLLAAVAILAAYIPAYHASRVDPITVLREE